MVNVNVPDLISNS